MSISSIEFGAGDTTTTRCHTDNDPGSAFASNSSGAGSTSNCRSRYGVADLIGNVWERTSGQIYDNIGLENGVDGLWMGQIFLSSTNLYSNFDLLRALTTSAGVSPVISGNGDRYYPGGSGAKGALWGGLWTFGGATGRWSADKSRGRSQADANTGGRCSL